MIKQLGASLTEAVAAGDWPAATDLAFQLENLARAAERRRHAPEDAPDWWSGPAGSSATESVLVTGGAGFIGSHLARQLLAEGRRVIAVDEFNDYYDPVLKYENVADLLSDPLFSLHRVDFRDLDEMRTILRLEGVDVIVHLGARAGVRPSLRDPQLYVTTNVLGTQNLLELAREFGIKTFVYASSSSVYGGSTDFPFRETQPVDHPVSPYAATKKANEVQASCYSRLFGLAVTGLRFFTVYGPGGRPDMSVRIFIERLSRGEALPLYGDGSFERDFTYIDDIVDGIMGAIRVSKDKDGWDEVVNLGESDTTSMRELILLVASELGLIDPGGDVKEFSRERSETLLEGLVGRGLVRREPEQLGDVPKTYADIGKARSLLGYAPKTRIAEGVRRTVAAHRESARQAQDPRRETLHAALRTQTAIATRAGLDSAGRPKDPHYGAEDVQALVAALGQAEQALAASPRCALTLRARSEILRLLSEACAYLGGKDARHPSGLTGLSLHRKRRQMVELMRAGALAGLDAPAEERLLSLAREVVSVTGMRPVATVVASAGHGTRIAGQVGGYEMKHRLFLGDQMLLLSLRNVIPYSRHVVAVVSERNKQDIAGLLARSEITKEDGFEIQYVVQRERLGDGDAHATASEVLKDYPGVVLFIFADAPTKSPETLEKMLLLKQALGSMVPLVIPCYHEEQPYSPILLAETGADRGRVLWNWQKADEADHAEAAAARRHPGLRNVGIFAAESRVFEGLTRFKQEIFTRTGRYQRWCAALAKWEAKGKAEADRPKEPEFGFADLMKVLAPTGLEVAAPRIANPADRLNVNRIEDAETVKNLYRSRHPFSRPCVERRPERGEAIIRFYDLDREQNVYRNNGMPSIRSFTRLSTNPGETLDSPSFEQRLSAEIESMSERIHDALGLEILEPLTGRLD